ncbi:MAG: TraR/DksA C4-type zinc finger protein [Chloroflexota bacterium]
MDDVTELNLDQIRVALEAERVRLLRHAAAIIETDQDDPVGREISFNPDRSDLADEYAERERDLALSVIEHEQVAQIEAALRRIDEGTYGICLSCGEPIAPGRLEVLPYATLCIRCQSKRITL